MLKSLICILLILIAAQGYCGDGRLVKGVTADGSCAVVGMTAEQARLTALQNARMGVIEKAAGGEGELQHSCYGRQDGG